MGAYRAIGLAALILGSIVPSTARALDVQVSSTTSTQIYEITGGQPGLFLTRRRVTERLTLRADRILPREESAGYDGPRLSLAMIMRINADFGLQRREILPGNELWYVPGYDPYALDLMLAELRVRGLFSDTTDLRAGRIITLDPTGFSALDGLEVSLRLPWHLRLWVQTGAEVVAGQRLSSGTFDTDGVLLMRRDELREDQHEEFGSPPARVVVGAGASVTDLGWLAVDLAYRQGIVVGDGDSRSSYQRLAGAAAVSRGPFRGELVVSGDFALAALDEVSLELGLRPLSWLRLELAGSYTAPVFDVDSIFAAFWSDPSLDLDLSVEFRPLEALILGVSGQVSQAGFMSLSGEVFDAEGLRGGATVFGALRWRWMLAELRGRLRMGYGGERIGATARFLARLPGQPLAFDFRGTVLALRDDLPPAETDMTLGYVIGARYRLSHDAALLAEFEHNRSEILGQQFRFLVMLDLGVWL